MSSFWWSVVRRCAIMDADRMKGTSEIDLMIDRSQENAKRMMTVLNQVLAQAGLNPDFTAEDLELPKKRCRLKDPRHLYNLDILTPWEELSYRGLRDRSEVGILNGIKVSIVSLDDLITLKEYTIIHEPETYKHHKDLMALKQRKAANS
jgi:hypothetical protein